MAVTVRLDAARPAVESDAPTALFLAHTGLPIVNRASYVVSPDGQRFLMDAFVEESKALAPPITVVLNWLRAR